MLHAKNEFNKLVRPLVQQQPASLGQNNENEHSITLLGGPTNTSGLGSSSSSSQLLAAANAAAAAAAQYQNNNLDTNSETGKA